MTADQKKRAAEVLRNYAAMIEESETYHSGPLKGRCDPDIEAEVAEYRSLAAALEAPPAETAFPSEQAAVLVILKEMAWGEDCRDDAVQLYRAIVNA